MTGISNLHINDWGLGLGRYGSLEEIRGLNYPKRTTKTLDDIDNQDLTEWSIKLFLLMNLTWGYVDTILNLCAQMKLQEVKKQCREIKELKRSYYIFRQSFYSSQEESNETERGEWFEETFSADFDRLFTSIEMEAKRVSKDEAHRILLVAIHQALTLIEAVKSYARYCDDEIKKQDVWVCDCCMVQTEFLKMSEILGKFICAKDERFIPLRRTSSNILVNRLKSLEVWETATGQVGMKALV